MSPLPLVSVLMPARDASATIDEAVHSIVAQTFRDFELIVVDDGSTDDTRAQLDTWKRRDRRIRIVETAHRGIVQALETAAEHASGDLLARMDADDIAAPARIERQVALLESVPAMAACGTLIQYIPPEAVRNGARRYARWINGVVSHEDIRRDLFVECPLPHPTLVVRRAAYERVGRYQHVSWPEDYDLLLRLAEAGYRLGKVPEQLLAWREGPDRLARVDERYSDTAFRRCKAYYLTRRIGDRPIVVWGAGPVGKAFARALLALDRSIAAFVDLDPRKIGQSIHGAPVIPPSAIEEHRDAYVVAAVGTRKAREEIRASLSEAGFREPEECCAVA